ncbi:MAG TPA: PQQ-dependent sugar dehydrogenase [Burkholderiales bacterium]|nr:PQQ-dependent sugar dehydrogenase [Burkholderiales bacterium]
MSIAYRIGGEMRTRDVSGRGCTAPLWRAAIVSLLLNHAIAATAAEPKHVSSERLSFRLVTLVHGLQHPWSLAWLPDGRMLVTERPGRLRLVSKDFRLDPQPVEGVPRVVTGGQSGLFDVVLHPRYAETGWLYLAYMAAGEGGSGIEVLRAKLEDHRLVEPQVIFRAVPRLNSSLNLGGRLIFDRQGRLYVSVGDRFEQNRAQRLDDDSGKLLRLRDDGRVPGDNPFVKREGARPEIYTLGNRNIQGMALHPRTGELWTHEHGPQGGDEVNIIRAGRNYGWPVITYGVNYGTGTKIGEGTHKPGMEQPLYKWVPSIAPSGMVFYEGDRFPAWRGMLFVGALKAETLVRLELNGENVTHEERLIRRAIGRIRDVRVGADGYIYLLTDERDGVLARLEPES